MWEFWRKHGDDNPPNKVTSKRVSSDEPSTEMKDVSDSPTHIKFKDLRLLAHQYSSDDDDQAVDGAGGGPQSDGGRSKNKNRKKRVDRQKLIVIFVGLPARGKTFLCNKLLRYLNWLGHPARHFNVGQYRRIQCEGLPFQDAHFFDPENPEGQEARNRALCAALDDVEAWLVTDEAQVAMVDATNSTEVRRQQLIQRFRGRWDYIFVESVCNDREVLERNYKLKLLYSPDYAGMEPERALQDFRDRISKYEAAYETIANRSIHYIKLIDMVTGRGHMDVNRISGYLPGKMVMYLMQICRALGQRRRIWLTRHGESEFNMLGKIGGNAGLSSRGAVYAALLPQILLDRVPAAPEGAREPVAVWTSTLARTIMTAARLPFPKVQWKALDEIQSGICDGMTYDEIRARLPGEFELRRRDKLRYRYPSGESYMDVVQRLEPVVTELESERDCVCIVSHQAVLRVLYGYFMNRPLEEVPTLEIPLHTIIELTPQPDGTMAEAQFQVDVDLAMRSKTLLSELFSAGANPGGREYGEKTDRKGSGGVPALGSRGSVPSLASQAAGAGRSGLTPGEAGMRRPVPVSSFPDALDVADAARNASGSSFSLAQLRAADLVHKVDVCGLDVLDGDGNTFP